MQDFLDPTTKTKQTASISNMTDTVIQPTFFCFQTHLVKTEDPLSFKQAVTQSQWVDAMNKELDAMEVNNTWDVTTLPSGKTAIGCKWLFKTKFKQDGNVERCKARLVILGCRQKFGEDYRETFALVAKMTTV